MGLDSPAIKTKSAKSRGFRLNSKTLYFIL